MSSSQPRIAIVTGTTSGIGEATARTFVANGIRVIGNGRTESKLKAMKEELGDGFDYVAGDAADESVQDELFETAKRSFGHDADIVVANAGRGLGGSVKDADLSEFRQMLEVNVTGTMFLCQKAARRMVEAQKTAFPEKAADIVIIGSVVGKHVSPFSTVYGATKFAVHGLAEGLRRDVGPKGVRVSLMMPGVVISGFQDVSGYSDEMVEGFHERFGPLPSCDDIAQTMLYVINQPPHINISDILVRATRQDYP